jgi:hypothetical protein
VLVILTEDTMMTVKILSVLGIAFAGLLFSAVAGSAGAVEVDIKFSERLAKLMPKINRIERGREEHFRRTRQTQKTTLVNPRRYARIRWPAIDWANEVLVPDFDDFSVETLTRGLVAASLERAGVNGVERVEVKLDRLYVKDHSLATISGRSSLARGSISAYDAAGKLIGTADLTAILVRDFLTASIYEGPDFAFPETSGRLRVGPTLAYFVYKGLGEIFPDREFAKTIMLVF